MYLLSGQVATTHRLEGHDHISNLQVSFLLQVGQDSRSEEDFALPNPVQVGVKFQGFDLRREKEKGCYFQLFCLFSGAMYLGTIPPRSATGNMTQSWEVTIGCLGRVQG